MTDDEVVKYERLKELWLNVIYRLFKDVIDYKVLGSNLSKKGTKKKELETITNFKKDKWFYEKIFSYIDEDINYNYVLNNLIKVFNKKRIRIYD